MQCFPCPKPNPALFDFCQARSAAQHRLHMVGIRATGTAAE